MSPPVPISPHRPRFNPFALPSDTDFRFMLLIVTAIAVSLWYFYILTLHNIPLWGQHLNATFYACFEATFGSSAAAQFTDPSFVDAVVEATLGSPGAHL
jgi:hypothetical protein